MAGAAVEGEADCVVAFVLHRHFWVHRADLICKNSSPLIQLSAAYSRYGGVVFAMPRQQMQSHACGVETITLPCQPGCDMYFAKYIGHRFAGNRWSQESVYAAFVLGVDSCS